MCNQISAYICSDRGRVTKLVHTHTVTGDVYIRLKMLEDRLLKMESMSPEVFGLALRAAAPCVCVRQTRNVVKSPHVGNFKFFEVHQKDS